MLAQLSPTLIALLAFAAVAIAVFAVGQYISGQVRVQQRIGGHAAAPNLSTEKISSFDSIVSNYFDEKRFGVEGSVRAKLRRDLTRAGFFRPDATNYYIFARLATVVVLVLAAYAGVQAFLLNYPWWLKFGVIMVALMIAVLGPDAYIARRQRLLQASYRLTFPDLLDLMVVCVDAGLSLEAALERLSREMVRQNRYLSTNLLILGAETRAGRSTPEALASLADRLGLDEARSFAAMLRQSVELGTDVGDSLRVFSDEMRDRRLLRAEERANQLPVKMVAPLGMFIFPVILIVVMFPIMVRLMSVLK